MGTRALFGALPPTLETSQSRWVNLGAVVTRTSSPASGLWRVCTFACPVCPGRVCRGHCVVPMCPGGGTRLAHCTAPADATPDGHCAAARPRGEVEGARRTEWDFSKPLRKETRRGRKLYCCQKLYSLHQVHTRASEAGTPSTNNSQLERPS